MDIIALDLDITVASVVAVLSTSGVFLCGLLDFKYKKFPAFLCYAVCILSVAYPVASNWRDLAVWYSNLNMIVYFGVSLILLLLVLADKCPSRVPAGDVMIFIHMLSVIPAVDTTPYDLMVVISLFMVSLPVLLLLNKMMSPKSKKGRSVTAVAGYAIALNVYLTVYLYFF